MQRHAIPSSVIAAVVIAGLALFLALVLYANQAG